MLIDEGRRRQLEAWRSMPGSRRLEIAVELTEFVLASRDARLRRDHPHATEEELSWARVREALRLPPGTTPP